MGILGVPGNGNNIPQDTKKLPNQGQNNYSLSENYSEQFKQAFKGNSSRVADLYQKTQNVMAKEADLRNSLTQKEELLKELEKNVTNKADELKIAQLKQEVNKIQLELDKLAQKAEADFAKANKEKAKAELRRLESEYNKNYEKMTSEEIIEMEFKMDAIKKDLATGKYDKPQDDSNLVGVDAQMLNTYNLQKQAIEEELKNVGYDSERKIILETKLSYIESRIAEIQDKIKEDFEFGLKPNSAE